MDKTIVISQDMPSSSSGTFILGDAYEVLRDLVKIHAGHIDLIYMDPPSVSNSTYCISSAKSKTAKTKVYSDFKTSECYLDYIRSILPLSHDLLSRSGTLFFHCTPLLSAYIRIELDKVFGKKNYVNEIVSPFKSKGRSTRRFSQRHDCILVYAVSKAYYFNTINAGQARGEMQDNHLKKSFDEDGRIYYTVNSRGKKYRYYADEPVAPSDIWNDIDSIGPNHVEHTGYPGQKPIDLLKRILLTASKQNATVLDVFSGSGSLAVAAIETGRSWISIDNSPIALLTLRKRIQSMDTPIIQNTNKASFISQITPCFMGDIEISEKISIQDSVISIDNSDKSIIYAALGEISGGSFIPAVFTYKRTDRIAFNSSHVGNNIALHITFSDYTEKVILM